ncbi:hypothetical protein ACWEPC_00510 [Nonomuraea sp. NPDC004297]
MAEYEGDVHWYDLLDDEAEEDRVTCGDRADAASGLWPRGRSLFRWARGGLGVAR